MKALRDTLREHKRGNASGIYAVCSSHPMVIEAALRAAARDDHYALIEATSNQVNQFGGYTGMCAGDFRDYVAGIAARSSVPMQRVLLGGDHLGPNCWRGETAEIALQRSERLVADYVSAGFRKIHLDCSMACADDVGPLSDAIVAGRAARLCQVSESSWRARGGEPPMYVVGTEVPTPGGAPEELGTLAVTTPSAVDTTLGAHYEAFLERGLADAWERVCALVVQPGVEFDHYKVIDYQPDRAQALSRRIEPESGLVYEAHSTDYQTPAALAALVRDHFAILKVGPAVTFALREALWALCDIERELGVSPATPLKQAVLQTMQHDPRHWRAYYTDEGSQRLDLQYSLSDRIRYYWNVPEVSAACDALLANLRTSVIPLSLLSQYLPVQYAAVREGSLTNDPRELLLANIDTVLSGYAGACYPQVAASQRLLRLV
jgi:D-tagatose-1,6-bisphosphate aldolase subunit GatZ/KbaZ